MEMSFAALIFQGIPEMIAVATLGFSMAKLDLAWRRIVIIGCAMGLLAFIIRLLPVTFGVHTIVLLVMIIISLNKFGATHFVAIISGLLSFLTLVICETLVSLVIFGIFELSPVVVAQNDFLKIITGIPEVLMIFLVSFLVLKFRRRGKNELFKV